MKFQVFTFLEEAAAKWQNKTAVYDNGKAISFNALHTSAFRLCAAIEAVKDLRGKGIGFVCRNGSRFISGLFACAKAGMVVMPVLHGTRPTEIEMLLRESSIGALLAEKENKFSFLSPFERHRVSDDFDLYIFPKAETLKINNLFPGSAFIRPSSGTTGASKGVVISHEAVFERTAAANEGLRLNDESRVLWLLPMAFHFVVSVILYMRYGTSMVICEDFTAESIVGLANRFKATHLYASPLHFRLLAAEENMLKFETLQTAISTSAQLESSVSKTFFQKYNIGASQAYGIIEIGLPFINNEKDNSRHESIGKVLPSYQAAILDENFQSLPPGNQGSLAIRGPGMFSGYLWPLKAISEVLADGWFLTGDIAEMDDEGFVFIRGRSKSMINVSGNKVFPEEVESLLNMHPDVSDARVYGGSHPITGEIVEAEIVLRPSAEKNPEKLISFCRERLLSYKVPQRIFFVEKISKTQTGKTRRA
jgi:long-chain acyl-CoA synthetase